jgi:hypothetical protein
MNGIPDPAPGIFHWLWRERGIRHGWYTPEWAGPMRGVSTVTINARKREVFNLHPGDTMTVTFEPLSDAAIDRALDAWFEAALKGAAEPIRGALLESHHERMRAALVAAGFWLESSVEPDPDGEVGGS